MATRLAVFPAKARSSTTTACRSTTPTFGFRVPDIIANLRVDQAWGFVGISAALHDASGAYYAIAAT